MSAFTSTNRFSLLIQFGPCRKRLLASPFCCRLHYSLLPSSASISSSTSGVGLLRVLRAYPRRPSARPLFSANAAELPPPDASMEVVKAALKRCSAQPETVAIRVQQKSYNYAQLLTSAWEISNLLCTGDLCNGCARSMNGVSSISIGVTSGKKNLEGARIGIVAKPSAEFVAGVFGTWLGGGVAVPLAVSYPEAELLHVMNDSDVSVLLSTEEHQELMKNVAAKCGAQFSLIPDVSSTTLGGDSHNKLEMEVDVETLRREIEDSKALEGNGDALIVYTSGTTGKPKGVVHTHKSITAQVQILTEAWEYSSSDQFLHCLPLHHVHGLFNALFAHLYAGAAVEFMPKFSVRGIWERWRESYPKNGTKVDNAITVFTGVPTMYTRLLQGYEAMDSELQATSASAASQLRLMMCGSSALPYPLMKQWETITGHCLLERYGMTEFVMALSNPLRGTRKGGTVGKPLPQVEVKILMEDEGGPDSSGVGELCVRSPSLFKEYWKQSEVTKDSFIDGGFFKTGDTVKVDEDGYYIILGRRRFRFGTIEKKRVIVVMTGLSMLNAGVTTQLLLDLFEVEGVVHYGIAGNANPDLQIGDVVVPRYWAHTGLWVWQRYGDGPNDELPLESAGDYTRELGHLRFSDFSNNATRCGNTLNRAWYQPEEIFPVDGVPEQRQHAFWVPAGAPYFALSKKLEGMALERCVNSSTCLPRTPAAKRVARGCSANTFVDNAAYRGFLSSKFNVTAIDMESAAVALVCLQQRRPFIAFRALSDLAGGGSAQSNEASVFAGLAAGNAVAVAVKFISLLD